MADTTGRIPLWIIGIGTSILVIGLIGVFFIRTIRRNSFCFTNWKNSPFF